MSPSWLRVQAQVLLLMIACLSLSLFEVARPFGPRDSSRSLELAPGDQFPPVTGRDEGGVARLDAPNGGDLALIFVVSPFCAPCEEDAPNVRRLMTEAAPAGAMPLPIDVVVLCLSPLDLAQEFMAKHELIGHLFSVSSSNPSCEEELQTALLFGFTPQAFLVGSDGRILLQEAALSRAKAEEWVERIWQELGSK